VVALQYVIYFRFLDECLHVRAGNSYILKLIHQGQQRNRGGVGQIYKIVLSLPALQYVAGDDGVSRLGGGC